MEDLQLLDEEPWIFSDDIFDISTNDVVFHEVIQGFTAMF
jgi:hypothetical protein